MASATRSTTRRSLPRSCKGASPIRRVLANTLPNSNWRAFAAAFNFADGASSASSASAVQTTTSDYVEQQLESDQGAQNGVGVQLALYFQRVAPTVTSEYGVLADRSFLEVAQTIFGLSPSTSAQSLDTQAKELSQLMPVSDLRDPAKLKQLTERFTAMYDFTYGPSSGATTQLTVTSNNSSSYQIRGRFGSRRRHQFQRISARQHPRQFHWRAASDVFGRPHVELAQVFVGRVNGSVS